MKTIILLTMSFALLSVVSCKTRQKIERNQEKRAAITRTEPGSEPSITPSFTIDSAWVDQTDLHVMISYAGGRKVPQFNLVWNGGWLKSMPPKAMVFIEATPADLGGSKPCLHHLVFDIKALQGSNSTFILLLRDYSQSFRIGNTEE